MQGSASSLAVELRGDAPLSALLQGVDSVIAAQDRYLQAQLTRNRVELIRGHGTFAAANRIDGPNRRVVCFTVVDDPLISTGPIFALRSSPASSSRWGASAKRYTS